MNTHLARWAAGMLIIGGAALLAQLVFAAFLLAPDVIRPGHAIPLQILWTLYCIRGALRDTTPRK